MGYYLYLHVCCALIYTVLLYTCLVCVFEMPPVHAGVTYLQ